MTGVMDWEKGTKAWDTVPEMVDFYMVHTSQLFVYDIAFFAPAKDDPHRNPTM